MLVMIEDGDTDHGVLVSMGGEGPRGIHVSPRAPEHVRASCVLIDKLLRNGIPFSAIAALAPDSPRVGDVVQQIQQRLDAEAFPVTQGVVRMKNSVITAAVAALMAVSQVAADTEGAGDIEKFVTAYGQKTSDLLAAYSPKPGFSGAMDKLGDVAHAVGKLAAADGWEASPEFLLCYTQSVIGVVVGLRAASSSDGLNTTQQSDPAAPPADNTLGSAGAAGTGDAATQTAEAGSDAAPQNGAAAVTPPEPETPAAA